MNDNFSVDEMRSMLVNDTAIVSEEAMDLICRINGYAEDTMYDILYAATGLKSFDRLAEEYGLYDTLNESINGKETLEDWINANQDYKDRIIVFCNVPYDKSNPDDVPGVLFDGYIEDFDMTADDGWDNWNNSNYLNKDDYKNIIILNKRNWSKGVELEVMWR